MLLVTIVGMMPTKAQEQNPTPTLLFFTASWCGPCQMVKRHTFTDPEVLRLLNHLDLKMLDIDVAQNRQLYQSYARSGGVPELVLLSNKGEVIGRLPGYFREPSKTADFLKQAFSEEELAQISHCDIVGEHSHSHHHNHSHDHNHSGDIPEGYTIVDNPTEEERAFLPFGMRLSYSKWSIHGEIGVDVCQLPKSPYNTFRTGFYFSGTAGYIISDRWESEFGLSFRSIGGKDGDSPLRYYYLTVPAEIQLVALRTSIGKVMLGGGIYGGYAISSNAPAGFKPNDWDAGVRARLIFEAGTFRMAAGYSRSIVPTMSHEGRNIYNQSLSIGVAICFGR